MFRPNTYLIIVLAIALASCQSTQAPKPVEPQTTRIKIKETGQAKQKDESLKIIRIAIEQIKLNKPDIAENILKNYLKTNNDPRAQLNLALIYLKKQQLEPAHTLLTNIIKTEPDNSTALEHLAIIARQKGQFKKAKTLYLAALKQSNKPSIHLNLAILLDLYLNELEPALQHYQTYQASGKAEQQGIPLEQWIADLNVRIKRTKQ